MSVADFPDPRYLITVRDLAFRLNDVTLVDLRPAEDFAVGHIAGSTHIDIYGVSLNDSSEALLNYFLAIFRVLFGSRGVRADRPVVIYDHESGERAAQAVLAHPDVRILDGGTEAWLDARKKLLYLTEAPPPVQLKVT